MIDTIRNDGMQLILEGQLRAGGVSWLSLAPCKDFKIGDHQVAVYTASLCSEGAVFDAWVIMGGGSSGYYNLDNYPNVEDGVAQHLGRLALEGKVELVETTDVGARINAKRNG